MKCVVNCQENSTRWRTNATNSCWFLASSHRYLWCTLFILYISACTTLLPLFPQCLCSRKPDSGLTNYPRRDITLSRRFALAVASTSSYSQQQQSILFFVERQKGMFHSSKIENNFRYFQSSRKVFFWLNRKFFPNMRKRRRISNKMFANILDFFLPLPPPVRVSIFLNFLVFSTPNHFNKMIAANKNTEHVCSSREK